MQPVYMAFCNKSLYICLIVVLQPENQNKIWKIWELKMPWLNNYAWALVIQESGHSQELVARHFNVARSIITWLVQCVNITGNLAHWPHSGAPSVRHVNFIHHFRDHSNITFMIGIWQQNLQQWQMLVITDVQHKISWASVGIAAIALTILTRYHHVAHQQWTRNNSGRNWRNMVLSDESCYYIYKADGCIRIY